MIIYKKYSLALCLIIFGCGNNNENAMNKHSVSVEEFAKLTARVSEQNILIEALQKNKELFTLKESINKNTKSVNDLLAISDSIKYKMKTADIDYIPTLKTNVNQLESDLNSHVATYKSDKIVKSKKHKQRKATSKKIGKIPVTIDKINQWGTGYVAVGYTRKGGYKTLSVNSNVGNGWKIHKIQSKEVYFVHVSGLKKTVKL